MKERTHPVESSTRCRDASLSQSRERAVPLVLACIIHAVCGLLLPESLQAQDASVPASAADTFWSTPKSWSVVEHEISFESDGGRLSGTLYSPEGAKAGPALVVVQQAGTETRDHPLFVQIAESFNAIGYSVLLYDRRGKGESEGGPERPDYTQMARDAVAGKRAIAAMDEVHPERIGFWGLSQAGWLALEAAAISEPAFLIVVGSPLTTPEEQMNFLTRNYVLVSGYGEDAARKAVRVRKTVMGDYFRGLIDHDSATAAIRSIEEEPWFGFTFLPPSDGLPEDVEASPWILEMDYDPVRAFQKVRAPLLLMLGGEDFDIPVSKTLDVLGELGSEEHHRVVVVPGASHLMRIEEDPADQFELVFGDVSNSAAYFFVMGEWLVPRNT